MNLPERRTFWACAAGWALDGMDFMIYPLVIGTIIAMWNVDPGTAGLAGTVTLLASAVGGWLGGYLADRIGRVKTLQLTILWFSFFSLVCAFVQNFDQLMIARALLGLGFGGEWAAGAVLMGEAIRPQYRGTRGGLGAIRLGGRLGACSALAGDPVLRICRRISPGAGCSRSARCRRCWCSISAATSPSREIAAATRVKQAESGYRPALWEIFSGRSSKPLSWRR